MQLIGFLDSARTRIAASIWLSFLAATGLVALTFVVLALEAAGFEAFFVVVAILSHHGLRAGRDLRDPSGQTVTSGRRKAQADGGWNCGRHPSQRTTAAAPPLMLPIGAGNLVSDGFPTT